MKRALLIAGAAICVLPAQASATELSFEGEAMTPSSQYVLPVTDSAATNGSAMKFLNNDRATYQLNTSVRLRQIHLRLRGLQCGNPPQPKVSVEVGGTEIYMASVGSSYGLYKGYIDIPVGTHTLAVRMTNDLNQPAGLLQPACGRDLFLDKVTFNDIPSVFAPNSYRNKPLADNAPLDMYSAHYRTVLEQEVKTSDEAIGVNSYHSSYPIYTVPLTQATVRVVADRDLPDLQAQWEAVPLPSGAQPSDPDKPLAEQDHHLVVYQPSTDTMWEFYKFRYESGVPTATFGGRIENVSQNPGHYTDPPTGPGRGFGASATSIPLLAGVQRYEELQAGAINHAINFAVPNIKKDFCRWPAQRTDGANSATQESTVPLPEGIRFRLPANLNIDAIANMTNYGRMVAKAVQRYGMVLTDRGGNPAIYAEDPRGLGLPSTAYNEIYGVNPANGQQNTGYGQWNGTNFVLRNFPWDKLEALAEEGTRPSRCTVNPPGIG